MDPVSQAALGAAWAKPAAKGETVRAAAAVGAVAGLAPDLDLLIRSGSDPLLALEFHRHFTHALAFVPVGALIVSLVLWPFVRRRLRFASCYAFSALGFASHGILDACTSYGTRLFWPFSDARIAFDLVSVVDPLVTIPLVVLVIYGVVRREPKLGLIGIGWCVGYLGLGLVQHERAAGAAAALAASRGHLPEAIEIKPAFGTNLLWKSFYEHDGRYYVDAVRVGLAAETLEGESLAKLELARDFPWLEPGTAQWRDVERFARFAQGYLAVDQSDASRIIDLRYSLVPNRGDGLWGLELDPVLPADAHAAYVTMRMRSAAEGRELLRMIFGGDTGE